MMAGWKLNKLISAQEFGSFVKVITAIYTFERQYATLAAKLMLKYTKIVIYDYSWSNCDHTLHSAQHSVIF